jgi:hypothetical protein
MSCVILCLHFSSNEESHVFSWWLNIFENNSFNSSHKLDYTSCTFGREDLLPETDFQGADTVCSKHWLWWWLHHYLLKRVSFDFVSQREIELFLVLKFHCCLEVLGFDGFFTSFTDSLSKGVDLISCLVQISLFVNFFLDWLLLS